MSKYITHLNFRATAEDHRQLREVQNLTGESISDLVRKYVREGMMKHIEDLGGSTPPSLRLYRMEQEAIKQENAEEMLKSMWRRVQEVEPSSKQEAKLSKLKDIATELKVEL